MMIFFVSEDREAAPKDGMRCGAELSLIFVFLDACVLVIVTVARSPLQYLIKSKLAAGYLEVIVFKTK